jgi:hypothetical protein
MIQRAHARGHDAVLLWTPHDRKPGEKVVRGDLEAGWPEARLVELEPGVPLGSLLAKAGARALVGASLHHALRAMRYEAEIAAIRAAGTRLYSVDYAFETITSDPEGHRLVDVTLYATEYQRQLHRRVLGAGFARVAREVDLDARSAVVGSPMLDQLALVDRAAVRRHLGLSSAQPVILLMSLKMSVPEPWRRHVWGGGAAATRAALALVRGHARLVPEILGGNGYRRLMDAARSLARRCGGALVVKSREKNGDPAFVRRRADCFVGTDVDLQPYASIRLMAIADLCVHFQSGAALEAARAGVPSVSVRVPQSHLADYPGYRETFGGEPGTLQNFPGVVWSMDHQEVSARLAAATLGDFKMDEDARRRYVEQFVGRDDAQSSDRALDVIERGA